VNDPYLYDIELLRHRKLQQLEMFPERNFPPVAEPAIRLVTILNGVRVDTFISPEATPEEIGGHAKYVAQSLAEGYTFNMQGGRSRKRRTK